jgi:hypothetical protein
MRRTVTAFVLAGYLAGGCGGGNDPSSAQRPSPTVKQRSADQPRSTGASAWDDCAGQLQNLCGQLFFYYAQKRTLPKTLEELAAFPGPHPNVPLTCPASKQSYVYTPDSQLSAGSLGRIVIHDAAPSHSGHRWVVAVREVPGPQLIAEVVRVPESVFGLPPQPSRE